MECLYGQGGHAAVFDSSRIGRPHSAQSDDIVERVNNITMADMPVGLKQLSSLAGRWRRKCVQNTGTVRL